MDFSDLMFLHANSECQNLEVNVWNLISGTQILLTSLAPSLYWEFSMGLAKSEEGARDVKHIRVPVVTIIDNH